MPLNLKLKPYKPSKLYAPEARNHLKTPRPRAFLGLVCYIQAPPLSVASVNQALAAFGEIWGVEDRAQGPGAFGARNPGQVVKAYGFWTPVLGVG